MTKYYVIRQSEDGLDIREYGTVEQMKAAVFEPDLPPEYQPVFLSDMPRIMDGYFDGVTGRNVMVLIKGEIIVPKPVQRVTEWEIE